MKKLILFFVLLLGMQQAMATCRLYFAEVYPKGEDLSQNPIILLDYNKGYTKVLADAKFYLVTDEGRRIDVEIVEENTAPSYAQMILKPTKLLDKGVKVSLNVENLTIESESNKNRRDAIKRLYSIIEKTWTVSVEEDKISPQYDEEITGTYDDCLMCCPSGLSIKFDISYKDNVKYEYSYDNNKRQFEQTLVEVTDKKGYKYIIPAINNYFLLSDISCGTNYNLEPDTQYQFEFRLMDFSGNISKEVKTFKIKTDISSIIKEAQRQDEILRRWEEEQAKKKN